MKKILFLVPMIVLMAAGCNSKQPAAQSNQSAVNQPQAQVQSSPANQQTQAQSATQGKVYENDYMKVFIPAGWTAKQVNQNPAAVNVTKGNYIIYINTQASQASGVEGGRFAEIAMGAPSADAVVVEQPNECGTSEIHPGQAVDHPRVDLYVSAKDKQPWCTVPSNGKTVWFFSYISGSKGEYFNYYKESTAISQPLAYVITMAYNSKNVNSFPVKGSPTLNGALDEMMGIIKTLEIKQQ